MPGPSEATCTPLILDAHTRRACYTVHCPLMSDHRDESLAKGPHQDTQGILFFERGSRHPSCFLGANALVKRETQIWHRIYIYKKVYSSRVFYVCV